MDKGYIQVYTGNGKGKTTAAFGLALRALCSGKKVYIGQFVKGMDYSELTAPKYFSNLIIEQFGRDCFIYKNPSSEDISLAHKGLDTCKKVIFSGNYDLVILDEINIALYYNLFSVEEVLNILIQKPQHVEVVLTGRNAPVKIIEFADLVTEMKEIKHYYSKGIAARKGIEF